MESFRKLGLSNEMIKIIESAKFTEPSEIQERTIPLVLAGKDVMGGSATGSGKTLAFGAGIIERAEHGKGIQALILVPTRELAEQVGKVFVRFSSYRRLQVAMVYGGVGINPQIHELESADIVVGTPGRILDHLDRRTINLTHVKTLVLDEADRMLDMGFIDDVRTIIDRCPKQRQTLLFSATLSPDITLLAKHYMHNPVEVSVEQYVDPSLLKQVYYDVPKDVKFSLLVHLLKQEKPGLVMVFCNTRTNTDFVARNLANNNIEAMAIHGGLSQMKRNKIMEQFHSAKVYVLVCTDVAARGLDIKNVSHVYNYDIPPSSKEYVHRIGRTARAGKEGFAISIVSERDYANFRSVLQNPDLKITQEQLPQIERAMIRIHDSRGHGGGRGDRRDFRGGGRSFGSRGGFGGRRESRFGGERRGGHSRDSSRGSRFGDRGRGGERSERRSFGGRSGGRGSRSFGRGRY